MSRYNVGDAVQVRGSFVDGSELRHFVRGIGKVKEIRHDGYYAGERTIYIVDFGDKLRMSWASELKLVKRDATKQEEIRKRRC